jgi:predicted RNA-binding Zn-ribbon protein involved in translation (DUF1610 family)
MKNDTFYCDTCEKETFHRFADCQECRDKGKPCDLYICSECGSDADNGEETPGGEGDDATSRLISNHTH